MRKSWQEYYIDDRKLHEWLPWGGLVHENILRNKDESLMAFFAYTKMNDQDLELPNIFFKNGWSVWSEYQCFQKEGHAYLIFCWNPYYYKKKYEWVINDLSGKAIHFNEMVPAFLKTLQILEAALKTQVDIVRLKNTEVIECLFSSLCMQPYIAEINKYPGYLDVQADQEISFEVNTKCFIVNKKHIGIISLLGYPDLKILPLIPHDYRLSRRMLLFGAKEAKMELNRYMAEWSPNRKTVKNFLQENILGEFNGFYTNNLIFSHVDENELLKILNDVDSNFKRMGVPHIVETNNSKDIWWGSIPGIFRANLNPPIVGLKDITEMFTVKEN